MFLMRVSRSLVAVVACLAMACGGGGSDAPDASVVGFDQPDDRCPGSDHCMGDGDGILYVGVAVESINPVIVESEWTDENMNNHYDPNEPFVDVNGNDEFDATWMAGFGNGRPAIGVHENDGLSVRAIAFRRGDTTMVVAILDVVGYFIDDMDIIKADPLVGSLDVDHIIIGSTHVHEGVDTVGLWGANPLRTGLNPDYQELTHQATAQAIKKSLDGMKPARMVVAQKMTINSMDMNTTEFVSDTRDPIIYDPTMTIMQFVDTGNDTTIATVVNWAAHPEYAGSRNNWLTADYVNLLRVDTEAAWGGTTVFVNGALGGQIGPGDAAPLGPDGMPIPSSGLEKSDALGRNLAQFAIDTLADEGETFTDLPLSYRTTELYAQVENFGYHTLYLLDVFSRQLFFFDESKPIDETNIPYVRTRITYWQVGPVASITAPGELHPELWVGGYDGSWSFGNEILPEPVNAPDLNEAPDPPYLRDLMLENEGVEYAFVSGLCEDFLGYIVASFNYVLDDSNPYLAEADGEHYEETNSIGPLVEEQIQHPMMELVKWRP